MAAAEDPPPVRVKLRFPKNKASYCVEDDPEPAPKVGVFEDLVSLKKAPTFEALFDPFAPEIKKSEEPDLSAPLLFSIFWFTPLIWEIIFKDSLILFITFLSIAPPPLPPIEETLQLFPDTIELCPLLPLVLIVLE